MALTLQEMSVLTSAIRNAKEGVAAFQNMYDFDLSPEVRRLAMSDYLSCCSRVHAASMTANLLGHEELSDKVLSIYFMLMQGTSANENHR